MTEDFKDFDSDNYDAKALIYELPDGYDYDYMVFLASTSIVEEETVWNLPYVQVYRRALLQKFNNWIKEEANKKDE